MIQTLALKARFILAICAEESKGDGDYCKTENPEMRESGLVGSVKRKSTKVRDFSYLLEPVGVIRSALKRRRNAPRQGSEGAPDAWLEISPRFAGALPGINVGDEMIVLT